MVEATKDYRLVYKGKMAKEAVLRTTPAAPVQQIRTFNADNPFRCLIISVRTWISGCTPPVCRAS